MDEAAELQQALQDHALQLGFKLPEDEEFLYLAREALHAPLPKGWQQVTTSDAEAVYFFNANTNTSVWEHPSDQIYRARLTELRAQRDHKRANSASASATATLAHSSTSSSSTISPTTTPHVTSYDPTSAASPTTTLASSPPSSASTSHPHQQQPTSLSPPPKSYSLCAHLTTRLLSTLKLVGLRFFLKLSLLFLLLPLYRGLAYFYRGRIAGVVRNPGGEDPLYTVLYDDGDREYRISRRLIRLPDRDNAAFLEERQAVSSRVERIVQRKKVCVRIFSLFVVRFSFFVSLAFALALIAFYYNFPLVINKSKMDSFFLFCLQLFFEREIFVSAATRSPTNQPEPMSCTFSTPWEMSRRTSCWCSG